jgi:ketosteroid isomerase-like protein
MADQATAGEGGRNAALVRRYVEAFGNKNKDTIMALVSDETVVEMPFNESGLVEDGNIRAFSGLAQLDAFFDGVMKVFAADDHIKMDYLDISEANDGRTIFLECRGGARLGNDRNYRNRYCMRFDFNDGKIVRLREYYNPIATAYSFDRLLAGRFRLESLGEPNSG